MEIENIEVVGGKGAGELLFEREIENWIKVLNEKPHESRDDESIDYRWLKSGINYLNYFDGRKELTIIIKDQKNLSYKGIKLFADDNDEVHRKMCELDGSPKYDVGYTHLFKLGICLIDFYKFDGGQDDRVVSVFTPGVYDEDDKDLVLLEESEW